MSEGVFAVDRGVFDHPCFDKEPFTQVQAWIWILSEAAWKPHRRRVGKAVVDLERGQLAVSYRFLAERWQWSLGKVQRFLNRLKTDTMVSTHADTGVMVITICNYNKYQRVSLPERYADENKTDTRPIRDRYELEDKESKESNSVPNGTGGPSVTPPQNEFQDKTPTPGEVIFGDAMRWLIKVTGKPEPKVRGLLGKWRKLCGNDDALLLEILRDSKEHTVGDPTGWVEKSIKLRTKMRPAEEKWEGTPLTIWRLNVNAYRKHQFWPPTLGPRPGENGYRGPPELLKEFGFEMAA